MSKRYVVVGIDKRLRNTEVVRDLSADAAIRTAVKLARTQGIRTFVVPAGERGGVVNEEHPINRNVVACKPGVDEWRPWKTTEKYFHAHPDNPYYDQRNKKGKTYHPNERRANTMPRRESGREVSCKVNDPTFKRAVKVSRLVARIARGS